MKRLLILGLISLCAMSMENSTVIAKKEFKKREVVRRLFAALPHYPSLRKCYDGAVTESDSDADLVECFELTPEQQEQNLVRRAREKYDAEIERANRQSHFNVQMDQELRSIKDNERVELYQEILKAHGSMYDAGYEGDNESAIMKTIAKFKAQQHPNK